MPLRPQSNCKIAHEPRGRSNLATNRARKLPMVYAALAKSRIAALGPSALMMFLQDWHEEHEGNLRIILNPTPYGNQRVLDKRPRLARAVGQAIRVDAAIRPVAAQTAIDWWKSVAKTPATNV